MHLKIIVLVKTNARKNEITQIDEATYRVAVTASPIEGKANKAVADLLAKYFNMPKTLLTIRSGLSAKRKVVELDEGEILR